ncbi:MAG: hypothetical protein KJP21_00825 [Bacteroidia bacterium]|nr:hypothetical protein [Bacteroidia bacterium]NNJ55448.1 hypothetical protein [Bacteroidia bacterium]
MNKLKTIRILTAFFIIGLFVSGITCFPIKQEVQLGLFLFDKWDIPIPEFVQTVEKGVMETTKKHPFLFYGTDWLAFAHILFALLFYGVYKDPIKNIWVTEFGIIACIAIFPLALIMGPLREIPFWWQLVDSSFGIIGLMCMIPVYKLTLQLIDNND